VRSPVVSHAGGHGRGRPPCQPGGRVTFVICALLAKSSVWLAPLTSSLLACQDVGHSRGTAPSSGAGCSTAASEVGGKVGRLRLRRVRQRCRVPAARRRLNPQRLRGVQRWRRWEVGHGAGKRRVGRLKTANLPGATGNTEGLSLCRCGQQVDQARLRMACGGHRD
jgi:hypothetical protein